MVDAKTWAALFASNVRFYEGATASASSAAAGDEKVVVVTADAPVGDADAQEREALSDEVVEAAAGAGRTSPPASTPIGRRDATGGDSPTRPITRVPATGSGCTPTAGW